MARDFQAQHGGAIGLALTMRCSGGGSPRDVGVGLAANSRKPAAPARRDAGVADRDQGCAPLKASVPPHTVRRAATKIHHRNRIVRSKREPIAAFATGPIR